MPLDPRLSIVEPAPPVTNVTQAAVPGTVQAPTQSAVGAPAVPQLAYPVTNVSDVTKIHEAPPLQHRNYCEPIFQNDRGELYLGFVGQTTSELDEAEPLFESLGTPGPSFKPGMILLPTHEAEYGSERQLHQATLAFINRYAELPVGGDVLCSYYIRLTWLYDAFSEVPYLRFRSLAHGTGKSRIWEVVGSLCRRATLIGGASTAASIRRIVDACRGTLLIDEGDMDPRSPDTRILTTIMLTGFQQGRSMCLNEPTKGGSWAPTGLNPFGPKIVAHHERFTNTALESRFIEIVMKSRTRKLPLNLPRAEFDREALDLRNQYLAFRRDHWDKVKIDPTREQACLDDRTNQIAIPLLSLVQNEADSHLIVQALLESQRRVHADIGSSVQGVIAQLLLGHNRLGNIMLNELESPLWEQFGLGLRQIGDTVRCMGLETKHTRTGTAVVLGPETLKYLRDFIRQPDPHISSSLTSPSSQ